jgi:DNA-binding NtrC family response regulator
VVFCDADPELAATVAQTLQQENLELCVVHSAKRLLERLTQGDVDVVVTDVLLPDMTAPDLLDAFEAIEDHSFKLVVHSYEDRDLALGDRKIDIFLRRPASREELVQAVRFAMQRKRSPSGLSLLLVRGDEGDLEPLRQVLSGRGHACLAAVGLGAAAEMIRDYRVDLVVVDSRVLGLGWVKLKSLGWTETSNLRVAVLSHEMQKVEKRLSETYGVTVVPYTPGAEEAAANAVFAAGEVQGAEPQI